MRRIGSRGKGGSLGALWLVLRQQRIPLLAGASAAVLVVGAAIVLALESASDGNIRTFGDALWYGIVTMTTVGYGDLTPTTAGGRLAAVLLMIGGAGLLSGLTATFASILVTQRIREGRGLDTIHAKGHLVVCGWSQYADRVLDALGAAGSASAVVLVNELPDEVVSDVLVRYPGVRFVRGDPASETTLKRANAREAGGAIVLADPARGAASDERAALVTLTLKSLRPDLRVTVEAIDLKSEPHLRRAGADEVVTSGEFNAFLLTSATIAPGISAVVRPLLTPGAGELRRVPVPPEFVGRTFGELARAARERDGSLLVAVVSEDPGLRLDDLLTDDTSLVDRFIADQFQEAG
ncbi:MAG: ion channel, partial [Chloroflexota bacterium]